MKNTFLSFLMLAVAVIVVFVCCIYIPYKDELLKARVRLAFPSNRKYWKRFILRLRLKLLMHILLFSAVLITIAYFML